MSPKEHGTCATPVQADLRWGCDVKKADEIACFNRHYAEHSGYFKKTKFLTEVDKSAETTYYDSVTGKPLFIAPRGRYVSELCLLYPRIVSLYVQYLTIPPNPHSHLYT